ncbi:Uncharacterized protein ChrSV_4807 [Chromobacterium vaccinii]|nr:Uncharacterized protein ChrSW_4807 [Chromobacterium vaccinii]QND92262.1 Uncharacterized protein ChrSV_4807 [Chromobacterium vaccinii]
MFGGGRALIDNPARPGFFMPVFPYSIFSFSCPGFFPALSAFIRIFALNCKQKQISPYMARHRFSIR